MPDWIGGMYRRGSSGHGFWTLTDLGFNPHSVPYLLCDLEQIKSSLSHSYLFEGKKIISTLFGVGGD